MNIEELICPLKRIVGRDKCDRALCAWWILGDENTGRPVGCAIKILAQKAVKK